MNFFIRFPDFEARDAFLLRVGSIPVTIQTSRFLPVVIVKDATTDHRDALTALAGTDSKVFDDLGLSATIEKLED